MKINQVTVYYDDGDPLSQDPDIWVGAFASLSKNDQVLLIRDSAGEYEYGIPMSRVYFWKSELVERI